MERSHGGRVVRMRFSMSTCVYIHDSLVKSTLRNRRTGDIQPRTFQWGIGPKESASASRLCSRQVLVPLTEWVTSPMLADKRVGRTWSDPESWSERNSRYTWLWRMREREGEREGARKMLDKREEILERAKWVD